MANINATQKSEITKLVRKEVGSLMRGIKKESDQNLREIASLKRTVAKLQKQLDRGNGPRVSKAKASSDGEGATRLRFTAKGLCSERKRLGLSADEYGKLIGVSAQSVYNWERGVTRPQRSRVHMIAAVRGIGKKEARARLAKM